MALTFELEVAVEGGVEVKFVPELKTIRDAHYSE
jgi:hypothetical protein